jgi:hypothetical protein
MAEGQSQNHVPRDLSPGSCEDLCSDVPPPRSTPTLRSSTPSTNMHCDVFFLELSGCNPYTVLFSC